MDRRLTMRKVAEAVIEGTLSASAKPAAHRRRGRPAGQPA